jgi:hypothetical protein
MRTDRHGLDAAMDNPRPRPLRDTQFIALPNKVLAPDQIDPVGDFQHTPLVQLLVEEFALGQLVNSPGFPGTSRHLWRRLCLSINRISSLFAGRHAICWSWLPDEMKLLCHRVGLDHAPFPSHQGLRQIVMLLRSATRPNLPIC